MTMVESSEQRLTKVKGNDQVLDKKGGNDADIKVWATLGATKDHEAQDTQKGHRVLRTPVRTLCYICLLTPLYIKEKDLI